MRKGNQYSDFNKVLDDNKPISNFPNIGRYVKLMDKGDFTDKDLKQSGLWSFYQAYKFKKGKKQPIILTNNNVAVDLMKDKDIRFLMRNEYGIKSCYNYSYIIAKIASDKGYEPKIVTGEIDLDMEPEHTFVIVDGVIFDPHIGIITDNILSIPVKNYEIKDYDNNEHRLTEPLGMPNMYLDWYEVNSDEYTNFFWEYHKNTVKTLDKIVKSHNVTKLRC